ncbi:hypothetical protein HELRODRAFT_188032 [Helobdella robusta]|uniref:Uncharacterized protein n=1 Tax=Helobdella robusta TaxID=6412 RepID=T1FPK5_HELRO|nr:hypothetical protein HELRODRAFT_188032 [Helobdella robusta]ESO12904.1 hypothetical protein HELRODRAFT_188032 [Helobdella robusta]
MKNFVPSVIIFLWWCVNASKNELESKNYAIIQPRFGNIVVNQSQKFNCTLTKWYKGNFSIQNMSFIVGLSDRRQSYTFSHPDVTVLSNETAEVVIPGRIFSFQTENAYIYCNMPDTSHRQLLGRLAQFWVHDVPGKPPSPVCRLNKLQYVCCYWPRFLDANMYLESRTRDYFKRFHLDFLLNRTRDALVEKMCSNVYRSCAFRIVNGSVADNYTRLNLNKYDENCQEEFHERTFVERYHEMNGKNKKYDYVDYAREIKNINFDLRYAHAEEPLVQFQDEEFCSSINVSANVSIFHSDHHKKSDDVCFMLSDLIVCEEIEWIKAEPTSNFPMPSPTAFHWSRPYSASHSNVPFAYFITLRNNFDEVGGG